MSIQINSKIEKEKEELASWKNKLIKNLSVNSYITEDLFIISNFWFSNYKEYILNYGKEGAKQPNLEQNRCINSIILGIISNQNIQIERLPKVFILNKAIWEGIKKENEELNPIMIKGYFSFKIVILRAFEKLYCFFFLDSNTRIRQGYLQIINTREEFQIISDFKNDGLFEFIKKEPNEINDNDLLINNENYKLYITNYSDKNEEINDIYKLKSEDFKEKAKKFYTTILKKKNNIKINVNEQMGKGKRIMDKIKSIFESYMNVNPEKFCKTSSSINLINLENSLNKNINDNGNNNNNNDNNLKKLKNYPRNSSVKYRILRKTSKKYKYDNFDLSQFLPKKPIVKFSVPGLIGLQNIGASCFMNATLQCFSNIPILRSYLLEKENYIILEKNKDSNKKLSFALAEVLKNLWEILPQKGYPPKHFKNVISKMNPLFKEIKANEPKDLILFLLETIHKELNQAPNENLKINYIDDTVFYDVFWDFLQNYTNENDSIISKEFNGYTNSMTI